MTSVSTPSATENTAAFRPIIVIPVYDHGQVIEEVTRALATPETPVVLVDDGSHEECARVLDAVAATVPHVSLVRHAKNQGKGAGVMTGFDFARNAGYTHVLQIDADGQHDPAEVDGFLKDAREHPDSVICGYPVYDETVPKSRLYGREITNFWVRVNTGSNTIKDSMCGLRVYPVAAVIPIINGRKMSRRMEFDIEIMVCLVRSGVSLINHPAHVHYPRDGVSHFHALKDNVLISKTHARLFLEKLFGANKGIRK